MKLISHSSTDPAETCLNKTMLFYTSMADNNLLLTSNFILVMYLAVSRSHNTGCLYQSVITGDMAVQAHQWWTNDHYHVPVTTLADVPTISIEQGTGRDFNNLHWVKADITLEKTMPRYVWNSTPSRLPPVPRGVNRSSTTCIHLGDVYKCVGFSRVMEPQLELDPTTRYPPTDVLLPTSVLKLADIKPNLRTVSSIITMNITQTYEDDPDSDDDAPAPGPSTAPAPGPSRNLGTAAH